MNLRTSQALIVSTFVLLLAPSALRGQFSIPTAGRAPLGADLKTIEKQTWRIFGKVTDLNGQPIRDASVRIDIGYGMKFIQELKTDVQGEFHTEYKDMDASTHTSLAVRLLATRDGYHSAKEFVDFGNGGKTWEIKVQMRPDSLDLDDLSTETLIRLFAPKLRASLQKDSTIAPARKDFERGAEFFLDKHDSARA